MHVLLAEDDMKLGKLIKYMLEQNGISTEWVTTGDMIYDYAMYEDYDVLVLDWMMPKMSGVDACKKLRSDGYQRAILLLTARDSIEDRVTGLDAGADDYLVKPFEFSELLARLRVMLRKQSGVKENIYRCGDLEVNVNDRTVKRAGKDISVSAKEFSVLVYLVRNQNIVVTREQIESNVWNIDNDIASNVVDVYMD